MGRPCNDPVVSVDVTDMRTTTARVGAAFGAAALAATTALAILPATAGAEPGVGHKVTYTVSVQGELNVAQIYYIGTEPASQADFNADSSKYLTNIKTPLPPGQPWVFETTLNDPTQWALVSASGALRVAPNFHCEIAVDGQVVVQQDGASGVQCALRPW